MPEIGADLHRFNGIGRLTHTAPEQMPDLDALARQISRAFYCSQTERWSDLGPLVRGRLKRERATVKRDLREMAEFIRLAS